MRPSEATHGPCRKCDQMFDLSGDLLPLVLSYGGPFLGMLLLLGAIGLPVPTTLLVIASGAFIRQGMLDPETALIGLCCVITGDSLSFAIGRLGRAHLERRFDASHTWQKAIRSFHSRAGAAIFLTRWLFTGIAIPTNLVAGGSGYRFDRFLLLDSLGEMTWIALFGGLGYWFGSQWEMLSQRLPELSGLVLVLGITLTGAYWGARKLHGKTTITSLAIH